MIDQQSGIKTFIDDDGATRWLTWSSSAYRDRDTNPFTGMGEIVSLDALKTWVIQANETDEYGPILWAHQHDLPFGQCDASVVRGAFLLETGTFDDTPLGRAALKYLSQYDGEFGDLGVSIGFECAPADRTDGIYDRIDIVERSVLPLMVAANPYTAFQTIGKEGAKSMSNPLKEALDRFTGKLPQQAAAELEAADKATEALDAAGVERKAVDEALPADDVVEATAGSDTPAAANEDVPVDSAQAESDGTTTEDTDPVTEPAAESEAAAAPPVEAGEPVTQESAISPENALEGADDEAAQLAAALDARMAEIAAAQVEQLLGEKVQQAVTEQVKALLTQEDGSLHKGLSEAVQWRLTDLLPGVAAAAVSEEIWRQLDQGGPLKDAMDGLAEQVTTVLSNLDSMANKQQKLDAAQKAIDDRLEGLALAPRAMQDAVRRAVWNKQTVVDDPADQPDQFTPVEGETSYLGPIKVDPIPVQSAQQVTPAAGESAFLGPIKVEPV